VAWATPRTWIAGEVVTATVMNQDVRDNMTMVGNPPRCKVHRTATFSVSNNTITLLTWNDETRGYDTDSMHSTATNTHRVNVNTSGLYFNQLNLEWAANATGFRGIHLNISTPAIIAKHYLPNVGAAVSPILHCSVDVNATAGQWFESEGWQTSGGALVCGNSLWDTFSVRRVSV
jgi:hypothetical protein